MAQPPKIDSEGLRMAKKLGAERVSSVVRISLSWYCEKCAVEVYDRTCPHCGKTRRQQS